jgi:type IV pilus assembly protein PilV
VQPIAKSNNKGFTLVETMVALVILSVSMLGILDAMVLAMQQNLENFSRNESVRIAEQTMNELRNTAFDDLANGVSAISRRYKQVTRNFAVTWTVNALSANSNSVQVQVSWVVKGKTHTHVVTSIISRGA